MLIRIPINKKVDHTNVRHLYWSSFNSINNNLIIQVGRYFVDPIWVQVEKVLHDPIAELRIQVSVYIQEQLDEEFE